MATAMATATAYLAFFKYFNISFAKRQTPNAELPVKNLL
jgi:hypothetical protein